jgi:hypothetical protein
MPNTDVPNVAGPSTEPASGADRQRKGRWKRAQQVCTNCRQMKVSHRRLTRVAYVLNTEVTSVHVLGFVATMRLPRALSRAMYALCHLEPRERHALPCGSFI